MLIISRSSIILDQWRKKAQLYRSNVLLVPLGDDFRYDRANEWDNQYSNYDMIISHINENDSWNAEVGDEDDQYIYVYMCVWVCVRVCACVCVFLCYIQYIIDKQYTKTNSN